MQKRSDGETDSVHEAFRRFERYVNIERRAADPRVFRLDRMRRLLSDFGDPHFAVPTVHLAGSKGKGSTAAFIAAALHGAGLTVGVYNSPHVVSYRERIRFLGRAVPDSMFIDAVEEIERYVAQRHTPIGENQRGPTTFELLTLTAFLLFQRAGVDIAVVETGLGGRLDATNVVLPELTVITPIEIEHTEYLGSTLADIAREKAGIIKPGVTLLLARQPAEAEQEIRSVAARRSAPVTSLGEALLSFETHAVRDATLVRYRLSGAAGFNSAADEEELEVPIPGRVQAENAVLALLAARRLLPDVPPEKLKRGIAASSLPGRFQRVASKPDVILDGAHTPGSIRALIEAFDERYDKRPVVVFGCADGKRYEEMSGLLGPWAYRVIVSRPGSFKSSDVHAVHESIRAHDARAELVEHAHEAVARAVALAGTERAVLVTGSFYLLGAVQGAAHFTEG